MNVKNYFLNQIPHPSRHNYLIFILYRLSLVLRFILIGLSGRPVIQPAADHIKKHLNICYP